MTSVASPSSEAPVRPELGLVPPDGRIVLPNISWETYEALLRDLESSNTRLTYDQGELEIMSPSLKHGKIGMLLGRMIELLTFELNIPIVGLANTTWRSRELAKGCEADECYYVARAAWAASREEIDLAVDPPPDLAIEVDITSGSVDKLAIYAALKVPEVWRYEEPTLFLHHLQPSGVYEARPRSLSLPMVDPHVLESFIQRRNAADDTKLMREFQEWVRQSLLTK